MIKAAIFVILSMFAFTYSAHAEQSFNIRFKNASSTKILISPTPGRCFHTWDVPVGGVELAAGATSSLYKIQDKNSGLACVNNQKIANWELIPGEDAGSSSSLAFYREKGNGWLTKVSGTSDNGSPVKLSAGHCQVSQGLVDCLNIFVNDVIENGTIIYTISDTKKS